MNRYRSTEAEIPETDYTTMANRFDKCAKVIQWIKHSFFNKCCGIISYPRAKQNKMPSRLLSSHKGNSKWINDI
jgi:hypothetical protein